MYNNIEKSNALPVVADVARRRDDVNSRPIVRLTKQPYFQFINIDMGLEMFPGSIEILLILCLVQNRIDGNSRISFPKEMLLYILNFLKWSEMHYQLR